MNKERLKIHIKLCRRNLRSLRARCCANCPFEEEILDEYPNLKKLLVTKDCNLQK